MRTAMVALLTMTTACATLLQKIDGNSSSVHEIAIYAYRAYEMKAVVRAEACKAHEDFVECMGPYSVASFETVLDKLRIYEVERKLFLKRLADANASAFDITCDYKSMTMAAIELVGAIPGFEESVDKLVYLLRSSGVDELC